MALLICFILRMIGSFLFFFSSSSLNTIINDNEFPTLGARGTPSSGGFSPLPTTSSTFGVAQPLSQSPLPFKDSAANHRNYVIMSLKSDVVFDEIKERIHSEKELVKKVGTSFRITVTGDDGTVKKWTVDTKSDPASVDHDEDKKVDVEINLKDSDFMLIASGKLKPDQAFMQGKMKLKGNIAKAMKLKTLLDPKMLKAKI